MLNVYNNGHKVVAYPSIVTAKSNDVTAGATPNSLLISPKAVREKQRAQSAGRARRSGRNLVKDVYERLGVDRTSEPRSPGLRTVADQQRARSLSRGRIRHRWPPEPAIGDESSATKKQTNNNSRTMEERTAVELPAPLSPLQQRAYKARAAAVYRSSKVSRDELSKGSLAQKTNPTLTKDLVIGTSNSFSEWRKALEKETAIGMTKASSSAREKAGWESSTPRSSNSTNIPKSITTNESEWKDEKKEECSDVVQISPLSVKERLLAFGEGNDSTHSRGSSSKNKSDNSLARRPVEKKNSAPFVLGDHPPKIDIYAECNQNHNRSMGFEECLVPEGLVKKPSTTESGISIRSTSSVNSNNDKVTSIAEAFLSAIHASNTSPQRVHNRSHSFAPVAEFVSTYDPGSEVENVSLLSVNSEEHHYSMLSPAPTRSRSKSWNRVTAYTTASSPLPLSPPSTFLSSSPQVARNASVNPANDVERLVEERVRNRVNELERHMLDQLQTFMKRLDEKMEARVARLERTVQQAMQKQPKDKEQTGSQVSS